MTPQSATSSGLFLCPTGGNSLAESRVDMAEVQICGIPKQGMQEVDPTP